MQEFFQNFSFLVASHLALNRFLLLRIASIDSRRRFFPMVWEFSSFSTLLNGFPVTSTFDAQRKIQNAPLISISPLPPNIRSFTTHKKIPSVAI
jgi:hypothetical protein